MLIRTVSFITVIVLCDGVSAANRALFRTQRETQNFTIGGASVPVKRITPVDNDYDQCYVHVTVHNSSSLQFGLENATVTVFSRMQLPKEDEDEDKAFNYTGFADGITNANGQACILVHCRAEGLIFVEKNGIGVFALNASMQMSRLPPYFAFDLMYNNEYISFYTYPWGIVNGLNGPVFYSDEKDKCASPNDYHFVFSYLSIPDVLNDTVAPLTDDNPFNEFVWYYGPEGYRRTCYIKVKIKTFSSKISIATSSYLDTATGQRLGTFYTGPQYDISNDETSHRAACILYRCPAVYYTGKDMDTYVSGALNDGPQGGCCLRSQNTNLFTVTPLGFVSASMFNHNHNHGPSEGIYISDDSRNARARCFTGRNFLGDDYAMDVNTGFAFEYDCTSNAVCDTFPVVG